MISCLQAASIISMVFGFHKHVQMKDEGNLIIFGMVFKIIEWLEASDLDFQQRSHG